MYGENSGRLRAELTTLLRQHRIQHRLGGKGPPTMPETTTVEERQALGELIGRYRQMVLVWCLHAIRAANPHINPEGTTGRSRGPAGELRYRLVAAIDASPAGLPTLEDLNTPQNFQMVDTWRHAARAAALGEHDFGAGVGYGRLSEHQCKTGFWKRSGGVHERGEKSYQIRGAQARKIGASLKIPGNSGRGTPRRVR